MRHVYELRLVEVVAGVWEEKSAYVIARAGRTDGQLLAIYRAQFPNDKRKFVRSRDESYGPVNVALER